MQVRSAPAEGSEAPTGHCDGLPDVLVVLDADEALLAFRLDHLVDLGRVTVLQAAPQLGELLVGLRVRELRRERDRADVFEAVKPFEELVLVEHRLDAPLGRPLVRLALVLPENLLEDRGDRSRCLSPFAEDAEEPSLAIEPEWDDVTPRPGAHRHPVHVLLGPVGGSLLVARLPPELAGQHLLSVVSLDPADSPDTLEAPAGDDLVTRGQHPEKVVVHVLGHLRREERLFADRSAVDAIHQ